MGLVRNLAGVVTFMRAPWRNRIVLATAGALISAAASAFNPGDKAARAAATDPVTGLPVYPGFYTPDMLPDAAVCGKAVTMSFTAATLTMTLRTGEVGSAAVIAWYKSKLPAARHFHAVDGTRSQDTFFASDGSKQLTITGKPNSATVYSISFGAFHPALSASEMASFNTGKQICGR